jgi:hypothetical protein
MYGGINGSHLLCGSGKGSSKDEYPQHLHNAWRCRTFCQSLETLAYRQPSHDEQAVDGGCKERNSQGNRIEIVCCKTQEQVEQQENYQRTQGK